MRWLALVLAGCAGSAHVRPSPVVRCSPPGWTSLAEPHAVAGSIGGGSKPDLAIAGVSIAGDAAPGLALATHVGQRLRDAPLGDDVRTLWALGAFGDVGVDVATLADGAHVTFVTTPHVRVAHVEVGDAPELARLRALVGGAFEPVRIRRIAAAIEAGYVADGYLDASVEVLQAGTWFAGDGVGLCVAAERGPHVTIGAIRFPGAHAATAAELLHALGGLHVGGVVTDDLLGLAQQNVYSLFWERGYANVQVADAVTVRHGRAVDVEIAVTEGDVFHLGPVTLVDGAQTLVPTGVAMGELFSRNRIADTREAIAKRVGVDVDVETKVDLAAKRIDVAFRVKR
jgi:outer membrane protein assembly factor BamA